MKTHSGEKQNQCTMVKLKNGVKSSQLWTFISPPIFNENSSNFERWCINIQKIIHKILFAKYYENKNYIAKTCWRSFRKSRLVSNAFKVWKIGIFAIFSIFTEGIKAKLTELIRIQTLVFDLNYLNSIQIPKFKYQIICSPLVQKIQKLSRQSRNCPDNPETVKHYFLSKVWKF